MTVQLVTDSASQIPPSLAERLGVRVVPLTVTVDGAPYVEFEELAPADFYERLAAGAQVTTGAPGPGQFLAAYEAAEADGAKAVLSVHIAAAISGTCNSAQVAAKMSPLPVEVVDSETATFGTTCCVWAAALARSRGGGLADMADAARAVRARVVNTFVIGSPELLRKSGRETPFDVRDEHGTFTVFGATAEGTTQVGASGDVEELINLMAGFLGDHAAGRPVRGGVGHAANGMAADRLLERLRADLSGEIVHHDIPPSVGAHLGVGTFAASVFVDEG